MCTYLITFESTHAAIAAQDALVALAPVVLPVPREIHAGCGMALRFQDEGASYEQAGAVASHAVCSLRAIGLPDELFCCYRVCTEEPRYRALEGI
jgi:hypothetical protein